MTDIREYTPREITSRANPFLKHVKRLGEEAAYRRQEGLYVCDGLTLLSEALQSSPPPSHIIAAKNLPLPPLPPKIPLTLVPPAILRSIAPVEQPQGVLTLCSLPPALPAPPAKGRYLFLEHIQDPGNVGSLLRTAEGFGLDGVYLSEDTADAFHPKTVRAAMGALFRLPVGQAGGDTLQQSGLPFWATAPQGDTPLTATLSFPPSCIIALGNEGRGLSPKTLANAHRTLCIPMPGRAESLGVAAAGAVVLWQMKHSPSES